MKKIIILFVSIINIIAYGQDGLKPKVDLPNFTPPSPEAFQITKYGDVPVDEFNGKVNLSVPIYQYQAGQLKLPISLNYYGAGVKVNDIPTQTGINWTLDAGGVISREIRDLVDEVAQKGNKRLSLTGNDISNLNKEDCTNEAAELRRYIDLDYDTEADIFKFHFLNYSGSFYLDNNFEPKIVKNEQHLKIEIVGSLFDNKTILITDPYGVKYYFGGVNATEETQSRSIDGSQFWMNTGGITSFYLHKIEHPINGEIFLEYDTTPIPYEIFLNRNYTLTEQKIEGGDQGNACPPTPQFSKCTTMKNNITDGKYLKRIYNSNNQDVVLFNRTPNNSMHFKTVLNSIEIWKKDGLNPRLFSKIDLDYIGLEDNSNTTSRFFLSKIAFNKDFQVQNSSGKKYEEYRIEYNRPEDLPSRFSQKIDMLGYFNNVDNLSLVPCFPNSDPIDCPDRSANFDYASKGVLSRIYYPTGGYTDFEYESQPSVELKYELIEGRVYMNVQEDETIPTPQTKLHDEFPKVITDSSGIQHTIFPMPMQSTQLVDITLRAFTEDADSNHNYVGTLNAVVTLKITNLTSFQQPFIENCTDKPKVLQYLFKENDTYKIEIDIAPPPHATVGSAPVAYGSFEFKIPVGHNSIPGAGVRIKRIKDYAQTDIISSAKRFYYTAYHKINDIFADVFTYRPNITHGGNIIMCSPGGPDASLGGIPYPMPVSTETIHSEYSYSDFEYNTFKPKDYPNVTVSYGGDNFEQGGVEKAFKTSEESTYGRFFPVTPAESSFYFSVPDAKNNALPLDGLLTKEKTFKNINGSVFKIQEKQFQYEYPVESQKMNLFGFETYSNKQFSWVYDLLKGTSISYDHPGFWDPLNANPNHRGLLGHDYDAAIRNNLFSQFKNQLILDNDPLLNDLEANLASGLYDFFYFFQNDFTEANMSLLKKRGLCSDGNTLSNYFIGNYYTTSYLFRKMGEKQILYIDPVPASLVAVELTENDDVPNPITQEQLEASYKKIITTQNFEYGTLKGLPTKITTTTSDSNISNITQNTYANQVLPGSPSLPSQTVANQLLVDQNNIATPIQVDQYQNNDLLSTQRTLYKQWNNNPNHILPETIQTSKRGQNLEDRVVFNEYDTKGNPSIVSYKDGTKTKYFYNDNNQVIIKIENYTGAMNVFANPMGSTLPCNFINQYSGSYVTLYNYNAFTNLITSIIAPNCKITSYVYDDFHHLVLIKDNEGNILQEFDNNYKP
jgi:hypothetical protein